MNNSLLTHGFNETAYILTEDGDMEQTSLDSEIMPDELYYLYVNNKKVAQDLLWDDAVYLNTIEYNNKATIIPHSEEQS
jgi:hypothetical protein